MAGLDPKERQQGTYKEQHMLYALHCTHACSSQSDVAQTDSRRPTDDRWIEQAGVSHNLQHQHCSTVHTLLSDRS
jgi:hypothetical protein